MVLAQHVLPVVDSSLGKTPLARHYPTYETSADVVRFMVDMSGIPLGRLGKLLGVKGYQNVYKWSHGTRRPSAVIFSRYILILNLKNVRRIRLRTITYIDWEKGIVYIKNGENVEVSDQKKRAPVVAWSNTGRRREDDADQG